MFDVEHLFLQEQAAKEAAAKVAMMANFQNGLVQPEAKKLVDEAIANYAKLKKVNSNSSAQCSLFP